MFSRVADVLPQPGHGARYYAAVQRVAAFTDTKQNRLAVVEILLSRKPDLRGRKDADNMIINNTHKIISDMIFIIYNETISSIIINQ